MKCTCHIRKVVIGRHTRKLPRAEGARRSDDVEHAHPFEQRALMRVGADAVKRTPAELSHHHEGDYEEGDAGDEGEDHQRHVRLQTMG